MLALISPAKRLDFERDARGPSMTQPALWNESKILLGELKQMSAEELREAGAKYRELLEARDLEDMMAGV